MARKRNITINFDINRTIRNPLSDSHALLALPHKLRRLPHVFTAVLQLPFPSDADVSVEESPDCFRFVAETRAVADVEIHTVQIFPGVTKIVVTETGSLDFCLNDLELDVWRFRLPESTLPEKVSAAVVDGELVVTVPKDKVDDGVQDMWIVE